MLQTPGREIIGEVVIAKCVSRARHGGTADLNTK